MSRKVVIRKNPSESDPYLVLLAQNAANTEELARYKASNKDFLDEIKRLSALVSKLEVDLHAATYATGNALYATAPLTPYYGNIQTHNGSHQFGFNWTIEAKRISADSFTFTGTGGINMPTTTYGIYIGDTLTINIPFTLSMG